MAQRNLRIGALWLPVNGIGRLTGIVPAPVASYRIGLASVISVLQVSLRSALDGSRARSCPNKSVPIAQPHAGLDSRGFA